MSNFHEIQFPFPLSFGASGGPMRQTEITQFGNGFEKRNTPFSHSRRKYDAGLGVKTAAQIQTLLNFFEARMGQMYGFRFRDPLDHSSSGDEQSITDLDQTIGIGDGVQTEFQLVKYYGDACGGYTRPIAKPVLGSVQISVNGYGVTDFTVDPTNGVVVFDLAPASGGKICAGYFFDVPVRFDTQYLSTSLEAFSAGAIIHIPLIELRTKVLDNVLPYLGGDNA